MVQLLPAFARNKNFCNADNAGVYKKGFSVWKILVDLFYGLNVFTHLNNNFLLSIFLIEGEFFYQYILL